MRLKNLEYGVWENGYNGLLMNKLIKLSQKNLTISSYSTQKSQKTKMMKDFRRIKSLKSMRNLKNKDKLNLKHNNLSFSVHKAYKIGYYHSNLS